MIILLRAVLALILLTWLYLLELALVLAVPGLVAILVKGVTLPETSRWHVSGWSLPSYLLLLVVTLTLEWAIVRGVFAARSVDSRTRILVADDGALRCMVNELAERVGTAPPENLYLYADVDAQVRERARYLGFLGRTRSMDIGLPLLATLSPDQLRAVLAHELGHYARSDARLVALTHRGYHTIRRTRDGLNQIRASRRPFGLQVLTAVSSRLLSGYARLYEWVSIAVARRQEIHADAQAVHALQETFEQREAQDTGRQYPAQQLTDDAHAAAAQVTGRALLLAHAIPEAWADFLEGCRSHDLMHLRGFLPGQLFIAFQQMVTDSGYLQYLTLFQQSALASAGDPSDPHPSLGKRLRLLGAVPGDCFGPAFRSPLLTELQPSLIPIAEDIYRIITTSSVPAEMPTAVIHERPSRVDRGRDNGVSEFWQQIRIMGIGVTVLSILTIVVWLWQIAHSAPNLP